MLSRVLACTLVYVFAGSLLTARTAHAADFDWINSSGGFFQQTTNWDPVGVPGGADRAVFNLNGNYTVSFFGGRTNDRLFVGRDNVTFDLNNALYLLDNTSTASISFVVGQAGPLGGTGRLTIGEGTVTAAYGNIGNGVSSLSVGGTGFVTVTTGGNLSFSNILNVGATRNGTMNVTGGGNLVARDAYLGNSAAGAASVSGDGSQWTTSNFLIVGFHNTGTMNVTSGGAVNLTHPSNTTVCSIGDASGVSGVLNIDGTNSRLVNTTGWVHVGGSGNGALNISNGGLLVADLTRVASTAGSTGVVTIGGGDAALSTTTLTIGGGGGTVTINPAGRVGVAHGGLTSVTGGGRINLAGGTLQTGSLQLSNPGQLNWTSGTLHISNGSVIIGSTGVLGGLVNVGANKTLRVADLYVGGTGGASLIANLGGDIISSRAFLGENFAANGSITVSGAGSTWTTNDMVIGNSGDATLTIAGGGVVTTGSASTGGIEIAATSFSTSRVLVTGPGSTWNASTIPTAQGFVRVGARGEGRLEIANGARVINDFTHAHIGWEDGATGTAIVDGAGSGWDIGYFLFVGHDGSGSLSITGGGTVSAEGAFVGYAIGGIGTLLVDGTGSRLDVGSLSVGHNGHATLTVGSGATVQATSTTMATMGIGTGLIHVNGGTLRAGSMMTMGSAAQVRYDAGTFEAGALQMTGDSRIVLAAGRDKVVETTEVSMDLPGGSTIDLADNAMIVDHGGASPIADVRAMITNAYNGGSWNGTGIGSALANASTHGVGFIESSDAFSSFPAMFAGRSVDDTAVLIAHARYGDANLDGTVNLQDFNRLAANFGQNNTDWSRGDFTYDGITNLQDFNRLAANFGLSAGPDGVVDPEDWAALASAIPEPVGVTAIALLALLAPLGRRRRRLH